MEEGQTGGKVDQLQNLGDGYLGTQHTNNSFNCSVTEIFLL